MNARFVAGLAVAAIPIMSLLGAASASADITIVQYHNTVGKYNDPPPSVTIRPCRWAQRGPCGRHGRRKREFPLFAAPFDPRELAAIGQSWDNSFCHDADTRVSERCPDHGH